MSALTQLAPPVHAQPPSFDTIAWASFWKQIPGDGHDAVPAFGEFVTLHQQGTIRGCMGWWSSDHRPLSVLTLATHFQTSMEDAMMVDGRSTRFHSTDFYADPTAEVNLQALLLPLRPVQRTAFRNTKKGILLQQKRSQRRRATYLPGVFPPSATFNDILPSLVQKAGSPGDYDVFEYRTASLHFPVTETIERAKAYLDDLSAQIVHATTSLLRRYPQCMPYFLPANEKKWRCDDSQHVRNLSVLHLLETFLGHALPQATSYRSRVRVTDPHAMMYLDPDNIYARYDELDDSFAKPQFLLIVRERGGPLPRIIIPWKTVESSIFAWNWWAQVISTYQMKRHYQRILRLMTRFSPQETNEVAVLFEGASALYRVDKRVQPTCIRALQELGTRRRGVWVAFLDGSCRLDITFHMLNGLMYLCGRH